VTIMTARWSNLRVAILLIACAIGLYAASVLVILVRN
jgi:hypothetical protein